MPSPSSARRRRRRRQHWSTLCHRRQGQPVASAWSSCDVVAPVPLSPGTCWDIGGGGGPPWGHHAVPRGVTQKPGDPTPGNTPVVWPLPPPPTCSRGSPCATPPFVPHLGAPIFWGAGAQLSCPPPMCAAPQGREHFIFVFKVYFVILGWWERVEFGDRDVPPPWL